MASYDNDKRNLDHQLIILMLLKKITYINCYNTLMKSLFTQLNILTQLQMNNRIFIKKEIFFVLLNITMGWEQ